MAWPFSRKNNSEINQSIPAEIEEYYQAESRERRGVAWLLALVTLVVTVALVLGLFAGGRWAYRKLADKDVPQSETTQETTSPATGEPETTGDTAVVPTPSTSAPTPSPTSPAPNSTATRPAPSSSRTVPNTGPGDMVAIFFSVTILTTIFHSIYATRS